MVNLASKTIDEQKNLLLSHSKKIKKPTIESQAIPQKISVINNQTKSCELQNQNIQKNGSPSISFIQIALNEVNGSQSYQFENYQPFYNLVFCPDLVKEIFSSKNQMTMMEMRQKMMNLKTPSSINCFQKNLEKMKALSNNHDLLIQNYLKDKYTNSEQPNPDLLKDYYRYIKAKLTIPLNMNAEIEREEYKDVEKHQQKITNIATNEYQDVKTLNKNSFSWPWPWHGHMNHPHHTHPYEIQNKLNYTVKNSLQMTQNEFESDCSDKENKNETNFTTNCDFDIEGFRPKDKIFGEIFGESYESDSEHDSNLKLNLLHNNKKVISWFEEEDYKGVEKNFGIL